VSYDEQRAVELLSAVAAGDRAALEGLCRMSAGRIAAYVSRILPTCTRAHDVLVQTLVQTWHGARTFDRASSVLTWIIGIAREHARSALPYENISTLLERELAVPARHRGVRDGPWTRLMRAALRTLPHEERDVLALALTHPFTYDDIAAVLGIPVDVAKTRVFAAKGALYTWVLQLETDGHRPR